MWRFFRHAAIAFPIAAKILFAAAGVHGAERSVSIGYLQLPGPWLFAVGEGTFERETGYAIEWVRFETGAKAMQALHDGKVQITYAGSVPTAVAASADADIELFYVAADAGSSGALIVNDQSKIAEPQHLRGKRIGVQFWSLSHYHLLFALEQFKITENEVDIYPLTQGETASHWRDNGLDAAFIRYPGLAQLLPTSRILLWSETLNRWGKMAFDGFVADRAWSQAHPEFMIKFVEQVAAANAYYYSVPARWTYGSREVRTVARMLGGQPNVVPMLTQIKFPSLDE